jgi:hypothetical protein
MKCAGNHKSYIHRTVTYAEFEGIIAGTLPVCDEYGLPDGNGLSILEKNGKFGVANGSKLVVPVEHDYVEVLQNGTTVAYKDMKYYLYAKTGELVIGKGYLFKKQAVKAASKLGE